MLWWSPRFVSSDQLPENIFGYWTQVLIFCSADQKLWSSCTILKGGGLSKIQILHFWPWKQFLYRYFVASVICIIYERCLPWLSKIIWTVLATSIWHALPGLKGMCLVKDAAWLWISFRVHQVWCGAGLWSGDVQEGAELVPNPQQRRWGLVLAKEMWGGCFWAEGTLFGVVHWVW